MKKILLFTMVIWATTLPCLAQTQTISEKAESAEDVYTANYDDMSAAPLTHWSFAVKSGVNYMRTSPDDAIRKDMFHIGYGGNVEYSFTPLIGFGLDVTYNSYSRPSTLGDLDGATLDGVFYGSINFSNFMDPFRKGIFKKLNVYGTIGAGTNEFHYTLAGAPEERHNSFMAVYTLSPEYNLNRTIALLLEGQYRFYDRGNMGGPMSRKAHSDALTINIGLRIKLFASEKGKAHARNISMEEWFPKPEFTHRGTKNVKDFSSDIAEIDRRLSALENAGQSSKNEMPVAEKEPMVPPVEVRFDFGSSRLTSGTCSTLDDLVSQLKNREWSEINIAGHTDAVGTDLYNLKLSFDRAIAVKKYLTAQGIEPSRIFIDGNGEYAPVDTNQTKDGRIKNRRVTILVFR